MKGMLNELYFKLRSDNPQNIQVENQHYGVVGSGDLEVLIEKKDLAGDVEVKIVSPVSGFDLIWERVLEKVVNDTAIGNVCIEINDNNATPVVVSMRLKQAITEAQAAAIAEQ